MQKIIKLGKFFVGIINCCSAIQREEKKAGKDRRHKREKEINFNVGRRHNTQKKIKELQKGGGVCPEKVFCTLHPPPPPSSYGG